MKKVNERFGVVNIVDREKYEKLYQIPFGYEFTSFSEKDAVGYCKSMKKTPNYENLVVERIYNDLDANNKKEEIFRGGTG